MEGGFNFSSCQIKFCPLMLGVNGDALTWAGESVSSLVLLLLVKAQQQLYLIQFMKLLMTSGMEGQFELVDAEGVEDKDSDNNGVDSCPDGEGDCSEEGEEGQVSNPNGDADNGDGGGGAGEQNGEDEDDATNGQNDDDDNDNEDGESDEEGGHGEDEEEEDDEVPEDEEEEENDVPEDEEEEELQPPKKRKK